MDIVIVSAIAICFLLTIAIISTIKRRMEHYVQTPRIAAKPATTKRITSKPATTKRIAPKRTTSKPATTKRITSRPATTKRITSKPTTSKPTTTVIDGRTWKLCMSKKAIEEAKPDNHGRRWGWENADTCVVTNQTNPIQQNNPNPVVNPESGKPRFHSLQNVPLNQSGGGGDVYIDNGAMKIGFDMNRGAGIKYISQSSSPVNLLNDFDTGRMIQQSFYGNEDGSVWRGAGENGSDRKWSWNPVQGGSYDNQVSRIDRWGIANNCFRSIVTPRHWATAKFIDSVQMEQTVCLLGGTLAQCHFKMTYSGTVTHAPKDHELPAVFADYSLGRLLAYQGNAPWANQPLSDITPDPQTNFIKGSYNNNLAERWAAWVNDTGYGIGIYFPHTTRITYYKYYVKDNHVASCCYLAPLINSGLAPGEVREYDILIAIGNVNDMRSWFAQYR